MRSSPVLSLPHVFPKQMDRWIDGKMADRAVEVYANLYWRERKRETERQRDRETERQRDRETERQRDRETERQRDRETERQRDRETERQRDRETERQREGGPWLLFCRSQTLAKGLG